MKADDNGWEEEDGHKGCQGVLESARARLACAQQQVACNGAFGGIRISKPVGGANDAIAGSAGKACCLAEDVNPQRVEEQARFEGKTSESSPVDVRKGRRDGRSSSEDRAATEADQARHPGNSKGQHVTPTPHTQAHNDPTHTLQRFRSQESVHNVDRGTGGGAPPPSEMMLKSGERGRGDTRCYLEKDSSTRGDGVGAAEAAVSQGVGIGVDRMASARADLVAEIGAIRLKVAARSWALHILDAGCCYLCFDQAFRERASALHPDTASDFEARASAAALACEAAAEADVAGVAGGCVLWASRGLCASVATVLPKDVVCVYVSVRACVRVCARACICVCARLASSPLPAPCLASCLCVPGCSDSTLLALST